MANPHLVCGVKLEKPSAETTPDSKSVHGDALPLNLDYSIDIKYENIEEQCMESVVVPMAITSASDTAAPLLPKGLTFSTKENPVDLDCVNSFNVASVSPSQDSISSAQLCQVQCSHCSVLFDNEQNLKKHVASTHTQGTATHLCKCCGKNFDGIHADLYMEIHMLLQHGMKTYRCTICQFLSYEDSEIIKHFSNHHSDHGVLTLFKLLSCIVRPLCQCYIKLFCTFINNSRSGSLSETISKTGDNEHFICSVSKTGDSEPFLALASKTDNEHFLVSAADAEVPLGSLSTSDVFDAQSFDFGQVNLINQTVPQSDASPVTGVSCIEQVTALTDSVVNEPGLVRPPIASCTASQACVVPPIASWTASQAFVRPPIASCTASQACVVPPIASWTANQAFVRPPIASCTASQACVVPPIASWTASQAFVRPPITNNTISQALVRPQTGNYAISQGVVSPQLISNSINSSNLSACVAVPNETVNGSPFNSFQSVMLAQRGNDGQQVFLTGPPAEPNSLLLLNAPNVGISESAPVFVVLGGAGQQNIAVPWPVDPSSQAVIDAVNFIKPNASSNLQTNNCISSSGQNITTHVMPDLPSLKEGKIVASPSIPACNEATKIPTLHKTIPEDVEMITLDEKCVFEVDFPMEGGSFECFPSIVNETCATESTTVGRGNIFTVNTTSIDPSAVVSTSVSYNTHTYPSTSMNQFLSMTALRSNNGNQVQQKSVLDIASSSSVDKVRNLKRPRESTCQNEIQVSKQFCPDGGIHGNSASCQEGEPLQNNKNLSDCDREHPRRLRLRIKLIDGTLESQSLDQNGFSRTEMNSGTIQVVPHPDEVGLEVGNLSVKEQLQESGRSSCMFESYTCVKFDVALSLIHTIESFLLSSRKEILALIKCELERRPYERVQVSMNVVLTKFLKDGTKIEKKDSLFSKFKYLSNDGGNLESVMNKIETELVESGLQLKLDGSGWSSFKIVQLHLAFLQTQSKLAPLMLSGYAQWPNDAPGGRFITNVVTDVDCFELSMIAHFLYLDKKKNVETSCLVEPTILYQERETYFKFPTNLRQPHSPNDFPRIEKATNTNIFIYQMVKKSEAKYEVRILRRGKNHHVEADRIIYLLQMNESHHFALIRNFNQFMNSIRNENKNVFCHFCLLGLKPWNLLKHQDLCSLYEGFQKVSLPPKGTVYKHNYPGGDIRKFFVGYLNFGCYESKAADGTTKTEICAYSFVIVDRDGKVVQRRFQSNCEHLMEHCLVSIAAAHNQVMRNISKCFRMKPSLRAKDVEAFKLTTSCLWCKRLFINKNKKFPYLDWTRVFINDTDLRTLKARYIGVLCRECNLVAIEISRTLTVIVQKFQDHKANFLVAGKCSSFFEDPELVAKSTEVVSLTLRPKKWTKQKYGICLLDGEQFIPGFDKISTSLVDANHKSDRLADKIKDIGYSEEVVQLALPKPVCPFECMSSHRINLEQKTFLSRDVLNGISDQDYNRALSLWNAGRCQNWLEFVKLCLTVHTLLVMEVFEMFRDVKMRSKKLDPVTYPTLPDWSMNVCLVSNNLTLELLTDARVIKLFETSLRGGLVSVVKPFVHFNNEFCGKFEPCQTTTTGLLLRWNSLDNLCLQPNLPVGSFENVSILGASNFNLRKTNCDGKYCYAVVVDFTIPDEVKRSTDDLPLAVTKRSVNDGELSPFTNKIMNRCGVSRKIRSEKVIATHESQKRYLISLKRLQLYLELGVVVTAVHEVFRFKQEPCLKKLLGNYSEEEKTRHKDLKSSLLLELSSNSVHGERVHNDGKHRTDIKVVTIDQEFDENVKSPLLEHCQPNGDDEMILTLAPEEKVLDNPIYVGFFISENELFIMYRFFYNVLKKRFGNQIRLVYTDKDQLLLEFKDVPDIFSLMKVPPLSEYLDTSNFDPNHPLFSTKNEGKLGCLKSEFGENLPEEFIALQGRCYSVKLSQKTSETVFDCCRHQQFKKIHNLSMANAVNEEEENLTEISKKTLLNKVDGRRFYVDSIRTLAYGHPDISQFHGRPTKAASEQNATVDSDSEEELFMMYRGACDVEWCKESEKSKEGDVDGLAERSVVEGGASVVKGRASVVKGGVSVVEGGASVVKGGASVVKSGASVVEGGASVV